jgi:hypothetical protein
LSFQKGASQRELILKMRRKRYAEEEEYLSLLVKKSQQVKNISSGCVRSS